MQNMMDCHICKMAMWSLGNQNGIFWYQNPVNICSLNTGDKVCYKFDKNNFSFGQEPPFIDNPQNCDIHTTMYVCQIPWQLVYICMETTQMWADVMDNFLPATAMQWPTVSNKLTQRYTQQQAVQMTLSTLTPHS